MYMYNYIHALRILYPDVDQRAAINEVIALDVASNPRRLDSRLLLMRCCRLL